MAWVRQFIENQKDVDDAEDIVGRSRPTCPADEVFVFTPKGDVITLPAGATAIDFAYAIHSAVGNRMVGAKVDGRIVPLTMRSKPARSWRSSPPRCRGTVPAGIG